MNEHYENERTTEEQVEEALKSILSWGESLEDTVLAEARVTTYQEGRYLTQDRGMEIRLPDGTVFQFTIIQVR